MLQSTASDANFSLPYFKLNKKTKQAELSGLALFHKGKMVHALNREQMKAYMIIRREIMQLTYTYGSGKKSVTFRLHVRPIRVRVKAQHGRLHFTYQITMVDEIVEIEPWRAKPIGRKALQHIEHKVERRLAKNCLKLVRHIQKKHHYDVFWLAEEARVHTPSLYRTARWDQQFSDARFTFHVKIQLKRYGQLF
jgi:hypothetical protein